MDIQQTLQGILDHCTDIENTNVDLHETVDSLKFQNHMLHSKVNEHLQEDKVANKLAETRKELKELKALNPKKLKEQIKRIKAKNDEISVRNKALEADVKKYRREIDLRRKSQENIGLHELARGDWGYITLLPWRENLNIEGVGSVSGCVVLIFVDMWGIGRAIVPGKNDEPVACKPKGYEMPTVPKEVLKIAGDYFAKYKGQLSRK